MSEAQATHPITASEGRDNAFYHYCQPVEHNSPYASCLNKLKLFADGALPVLYSDCKVAMTAGKCVAENMREEELGKGVAIYYIPRAQIRAEAEAREKLANLAFASDAEKSTAKENKRKLKMGIDTTAVEAVEPRRSVAKPAKVEQEVALDFSAQMALAISREAESLNKPVAVTPAKVEVQVAAQAEGKKTMIEIAREMAAKRAAAQASL